MKNGSKGILSDAVLKNIAYITMFIDHFFAVVYRAAMRQRQTAGYAVGDMERIYLAGRAVGRVSFILFAYLAAEGFEHTGSRRNYLFRLGMFALVSEIPFDLAFAGKSFDWESQNIFFTLFLGVLALTIWEWAKERAGRFFGRMTGIAAAALCCAAAYLFQTDYKFMGVLLIITFYLTRESGLTARTIAAGCVMLFATWGANCLRYADSYSVSYLLRFSMREMYGLLAMVLIALCNGEKGRQLPKAFCYGFYPAHLLLLYGLAALCAGG